MTEATELRAADLEYQREEIVNRFRFLVIIKPAGGGCAISVGAIKMAVAEHVLADQSIQKKGS
jgi:hypothetical protein